MARQALGRWWWDSEVQDSVAVVPVQLRAESLAVQLGPVLGQSVVAAAGGWVHSGGAGEGVGVGVGAGHVVVGDVGDVVGASVAVNVALVAELVGMDSTAEGSAGPSMTGTQVVSWRGRWEGGRGAGSGPCSRECFQRRRRLRE